MKRILAISSLALTGLLVLSGCAYESSGPSGKTYNQAKPHGEILDVTSIITFDDGQNLLCYGKDNWNGDDYGMSCNWDSLDDQDKLVLEEGGNNELVYLDFGNSTKVAPCIVHEADSNDQDDNSWISCGFGSIKR